MPDFLALLPVLILLVLTFLHRHRLLNRLLHWRVHRAARILPKRDRADQIQEWLADLHYLPSVRERLDFVCGLPQAGREIRAALDPAWAASERRARHFFGAFGLVAIVAIGLASFGVAPQATRLIASTTQAAVAVATFTAILTCSVLALRDRRPERWRGVVLVTLGALTTLLALTVLLVWSALHPETFVLLLAAALAGHLFGRADFTPRAQQLH